MMSQTITCDQCGSEAVPLRIEIVANPNHPHQIVEEILLIKCPKCGERKQPAPPDQNEEPRD
jgi:YgiT-type zinc finger domain-containing protein